LRIRPTDSEVIPIHAPLSQRMWTVPRLSVNSTLPESPTISLNLA